MTVTDMMPALWFAFAFVLLIVYFLSYSRFSLYCCGGCLFALASSLYYHRIRVQCLLFFAYILFVFISSALVKRVNDKKRKDLGIIIKKTDKNGGLVMSGGRIYKAYPRDSAYVYKTGDIIETAARSGNIMLSYRI